MGGASKAKLEVGQLTDTHTGCIQAQRQSTAQHSTSTEHEAPKHQAPGARYQSTSLINY